jgi:hypothetical protein
LVRVLVKLRFVRYRSTLETKFAAIKREQHMDVPGSRPAIAEARLEPWFTICVPVKSLCNLRFIFP